MKNSLFKKVFAGAIAITLAFGVMGCSKKSNDAPNNTEVDVVNNEQVNQELVIGENVDLGGYDPVKDMSSFVRFLVFDCLVELGYNYEKVPGLATKWEMSDDGKTWTFTLRENVKFHDGADWNSEAARINFQHRIDAGTSGFYKSIESMETPDEYTFVINFSKPLYTFASDVAQPTYGMVSPNAFDEEHKVTNAIGTGPFKLDSWNKDVDFTMIANNDFYDGAPKLEKLTFKVITDGNARAMALEGGEIDMMSGRSALTSLESLKSKENIQIIKTMGQTSELVMINTFDEIMSDLNIRKAVAASVDFASAVPALLMDLAEPAVNFFSPVFGEYVDSDLKLPEYNPEFAKECLTNAGYTDTNNDGIVDKNGTKLSLDLIVDAKNEEDKALASVMQNQLLENGIELNITMLDSAAIKEKISSHGYQMAMQGQNYVPSDDPSVHYRNGYYHSDSFYNIYSTPDLDKKIDTLFNSLDSSERIALHKEVQKEITEQVPVIMMFHRNNIIIADNKLKGYEMAKGTWQIYKGLEKAYVE